MLFKRVHMLLNFWIIVGLDAATGTPRVAGFPFHVIPQQPVAVSTSAGQAHNVRLMQPDWITHMLWHRPSHVSDQT